MSDGGSSDEPRRVPVGVLLVNLGTPDSTSVADVRAYLREFLSDPRVLDMNPIGRAALLNLVILPFRPAKSAAAYRKIWTERGSPLLFNGIDLRNGLREELRGEVVGVELAMRYRKPPIDDALRALRDAGAERIAVLPLFPQYSMAASESAVERVYVEAGRIGVLPALTVVPPFYDHPAFIEAQAELARPVIAETEPDKVLFSFHGVPERHVRKSTAFAGPNVCLQSGCCDAIRPENRFCYRAQSYATARALARALELGGDGWEVAFQSRLGRTPWIRPYTDLRLAALPGEGVRKLVVVEPSFAADCLETIEEIGVRGRADFLTAGGERLELVPAVNASPAWVRGAARLVREALGTAPSAP